MGSRTKRTRQREKQFLDQLALNGNVGQAADLIGCGRQTVYDWRNADPEFKKKWEEAIERAVDRLEQEAWRRAVEGVDEPVYYQGEAVDFKKTYSDKLMELMLKAHRPQKYGGMRADAEPQQPVQIIFNQQSVQDDDGDTSQSD